MDSDRIIAEEIRKNDRQYSGVLNGPGGSIQKYIMTVLPHDLLAAIRAVAMSELNAQVALNNLPSQVLVDNMPTNKRAIESAMRRVVMRFQDTTGMLAAVRDVYELLQRITRLQQPPKNNIVARNNFHLYLNGTNVGLLPAALAKLDVPGVLTTESVVRVVGPLVNYGRRLFWSPVGSSRPKMSFYRIASKRGVGVRFAPPRGSGPFYPRFKAWKLSTVRKKFRGEAAVAALRNMLASNTPPGRVENTGEIVKRIISRNPKYRGFHFADGWIEYGPAIGWSKLGDPRVPAFGVMFAKKGRLNVG